jgi:U6 snRNA-associated Sm-like protein LSm8
MSLQEYVNKTVTVISTDGRNIVGILKGFDQVQNLVLSESHERVFSEDKGVSQQVLGLYLIRGDTM